MLRVEQKEGLLEIGVGEIEVGIQEMLLAEMAVIGQQLNEVPPVDQHMKKNEAKLWQVKQIEIGAQTTITSVVREHPRGMQVLLQEETLEHKLSMIAIRADLNRAGQRWIL